MHRTTHISTVTQILPTHKHIHTFILYIILNNHSLTLFSSLYFDLAFGLKGEWKAPYFISDVRMSKTLNLGLLPSKSSVNVNLS